MSRLFDENCRRRCGVQGRWTSERYNAAIHNLFKTLRHMGATSATTRVQRAALREEARKVVGDTGLLDHLLKRLVGAEVEGAEEVLRRQRDDDCHMEYWLQSPGHEDAGASEVKSESEGLTQDVHELRHLRRLASQARDAAAAELADSHQVLGTPSRPPAQRVAGSAVAAALQRTQRLEQAVRLVEEKGAGQFEALAEALGVIPGIREEMAGLGHSMLALQEQVKTQEAEIAMLHAAIGGSHKQPAASGSV